MAGKIVVDTSVLIKWIKTKDEELLAEAGRLLRQVESKPLAVHVPALLLYEIGNILLLKTDLDPDGLKKLLTVWKLFRSSSLRRQRRFCSVPRASAESSP
jgi:predicted nucleic acid-binding protein